MSTTTYFTADELIRLPRGLGKRYELVMGELREMSPAGWRHGVVASRLHTILDSYIQAMGLGRSFCAETGFLLHRNPDTVKAPDFAFIANAHLPANEPSEAYWPGAPDLAVEANSHDDRPREVQDRVKAWLAAGCQSVWVVDPETGTLAIHTRQADAVMKKSGEVFSGDPVLPGFSCAVAELFR